MKTAILTLEKELSLVEEGLKKWPSGEYNDIKKRQQGKANELKKAIKILQTSKK